MNVMKKEHRMGHRMNFVVVTPWHASGYTLLVAMLLCMYLIFFKFILGFSQANWRRYPRFSLRISCRFLVL